jgi:hypothetical protein
VVNCDCETATIGLRPWAEPQPERLLKQESLIFKDYSHNLNIIIKTLGTGHNKVCILRGWGVQNKLSNLWGVWDELRHLWGGGGKKQKMSRILCVYD